MAKIKIIVPLENKAEEQQLKELVQTGSELELTVGNTKNLDGSFIAEILGDADHMIQLAGSIASIYAVFVSKRVVITDGNNNVIKRNIKLKDISEFLQSFFKSK